MTRNRSKDHHIILPWEQRGGFFRRPGLSRARPVLLTIAVIVVFILMAQKERTSSGVRATRASLLILRQAVDAYRADHGGQCPPELLELEHKNYIKKLPTDAWGHHFILTCPGRFDPDGYELSSAGEDGIPGGLDRVD
ncbi:MAG: general secretion pathway protein GspG [Sorangium cellulosum]|nr:MAG: general secretion pathway protein GspG [Sorangium cellulosum]